MARNHAQVLTSIWSDQDWCEVPALSQRVYLLILSQARLSLVGTVDFVPTRWARRAPDTTVDDIEQAVADLERRRYVVVDRSTDELLVRTFVVHDLRPSRLSAPTIKGLWAAWEGVDSARLRQVVVQSIPEDTWARVADSAPESALRIRRSFPFEREPKSDATEFKSPLELPSPVTCHLSPSPVRASARGREAASDTGEEDDESAPRLTRQERAEAACVHLGDAAHEEATAVAGAVRHPDAYRSACRRSARADHLQAAQILAHRNPDWSPAEIAASIASTAAARKPPATEPQPKGLYEAQEQLRRKRAADAPPRDRAALSAGVARTRMALETARAGATSKGAS